MLQKRCSRCKHEKHISEFSSRGLSPGGQTRWQSACKPCRVIQQRHRLKDDVYRKKHLARNAQRRRRLKLEINKLKEGPCKDCGRSFPPVAMDFDHVRGVKRFDIAVSIGQVPAAALMEEIKKCEVVCAVCHRLRTAARLSNRQHTTRSRGVRSSSLGS